MSQKVHLSKPLEKFSGNMFADYNTMNPYMFTLGYKLRKINKSLESTVELRTALANKVKPVFNSDFLLFEPFLKAELENYVNHDDQYYGNPEKYYKQKYFLCAFTISALSLLVSHRKPDLIRKNALNLLFSGIGLYVISEIIPSRSRFENEDLVIGASRLHGISYNINSI